MNIELKFLQKAIEDRNYIAFSYKNKKYTHIKPLELVVSSNKYFLRTNDMNIDFSEISKLKILKNKF